MNTLPVIYGYARVSKADDDSKNLGTQLRILAEHGIRDHLVFTDVASGRSPQRPGWQALMAVIQPGDTVVVAFLDRFSRNFEEGVRIQADLTRQDIGIVAVRENIDTREGNAAAKFFRRSMLAQGAYQVDSASERIKLGLERAKAEGKRVGRPPALSGEKLEQCRRMAQEGTGLRQIARVLGCSPATVKKALALVDAGWSPATGEISGQIAATDLFPQLQGPPRVRVVEAVDSLPGRIGQRDDVPFRGRALPAEGDGIQGVSSQHARFLVQFVIIVLVLSVLDRQFPLGRLAAAQAVPLGIVAGQDDYLVPMPGLGRANPLDQFPEGSHVIQSQFGGRAVVVLVPEPDQRGATALIGRPICCQSSSWSYSGSKRRFSPGSGTITEAGVPPHAQARQLVEHGGDGVQCAGPSLPARTQSRCGKPGAGGECQRIRAQRHSRRHQLALYRQGRQTQTPPSLPVPFLI